MKAAALLVILPALAAAGPVKRGQAAADVGSTTSDIFPPASTTADAVLFPGESEVGYAGATLTGIEPAAIQTAAAFAYKDEDSFRFPLVIDEPEGATDGDDFDLSKYWGNLSPWYSVESDVYGLSGNATPQVPDTCTVTQLHLLYRHGARYPTTGAAPSAFAARLAAEVAAGGFASWGELEFLNSWTYKLGAELLTPFGRLQNFELGVAYRNSYGHLLNNFTEQGTLPVFRTESQDRMVKTANNFAAGFFGVPEYLDQVNIEIMVETLGTGHNNTGAPYEICTNANGVPGTLGSTAAAVFADTRFNGTLARLQSQIAGYNLTHTDVLAMLEMCSYETHALGYSSFCKLFTEEDFRDYEYYFDISFYYNNGPGSPVAAAQGKGFLEEFVARIKHTHPSADSSINTTLDDSATYFPLNQSIYADATHEVVVLDTLTAFNFTPLWSQGALDPTQRIDGNVFRASRLVPFATHFTTQILECADTSPTKQVRFMVNDAVIPLDKTYAGCLADEYGRCSLDTVIGVLETRIAEIDFDYDCFANYTAAVGHDYNGRAPRA
ncbi:hypothetical protein Q5752_005061 [Cryptotrichosporon argae]